MREQFRNKRERDDSSGGIYICQVQEFHIEEREMDICGRGVKESFIISLSLLHKELLDDVGMGGEHRLRIGWAHTAVEHQSPRH